MKSVSDGLVSGIQPSVIGTQRELSTSRFIQTVASSPAPHQHAWSPGRRSMAATGQRDCSQWCSGCAQQLLCAGSGCTVIAARYSLTVGSAADWKSYWTDCATNWKILTSEISRVYFTARRIITTLSVDGNGEEAEGGARRHTQLGGPQRERSGGQRRRRRRLMFNWNIMSPVC